MRSIFVFWKGKSMKAVIVLNDSLNRNYLPCYNETCGTIAPNFERLEKKSVTFDQSFIGSMSCMSARRDLHTGRYNFLHREWGGLTFRVGIKLHNKKNTHVHLYTWVF